MKEAHELETALAHNEVLFYRLSIYHGKLPQLIDGSPTEHH